MANIFEFLSKDGNITPEKARKSRQMQFHDKTAYVWMGILPLKKRINRDKCSFATKQRMIGAFTGYVFAQLDEILFTFWVRKLPLSKGFFHVHLGELLLHSYWLLP